VVRKKNLGKCSGLVVVIGRRLFFIFPVSWAGAEPTAQPHRWHFVKGNFYLKKK
jgi:hypothetical protein